MHAVNIGMLPIVGPRKRNPAMSHETRHSSEQTLVGHRINHSTDYSNNASRTPQNVHSIHPSEPKSSSQHKESRYQDTLSLCPIPYPEAPLVHLYIDKGHRFRERNPGFRRLPGIAGRPSVQ